ncbi:MAG: glucosyl-3-phosphoglycerate synthase [Euryarchaeota archaeon]|nr:glucosyl-3-phosphoglycerate synthase [Euryarchaeota archaeon]
MDFHQERVTTIHDFCIDTEKLGKRLHELKDKRRASIVLPILYGEVENPALKNIVEQLNKCDYLHKVIIPLAADDNDQYKKVLDFFKQLKIPNLIIWCNGPRSQAIMSNMIEHGIDVASFNGKGRDVWIALGVASLDSYGIALNDGDIINYTSDFPTKLLYPIIEPKLDYHFNKGYYARVSLDNKTMHGRVYRLFVQPLLDALREDVDCNHNDILDYFKAFRYTLSGEFAMTENFALNIRIPADWGLEVGILAEAYRNSAIKRICQTDMGFYDHKHQKMGGNYSEGLCKMAGDIFTALMRVITETTATQITPYFLHSLKIKYKYRAQDIISKYSTDAICNDLHFSRDEEERYVEMFSKTIMIKGRKYVENPTDMLLPNWVRTLSAMPDLREQFYDAAVEDAKEWSNK